MSAVYRGIGKIRDERSVGGDKACFINALLHKASGIVQEHMKDTYILTMWHTYANNSKNKYWLCKRVTQGSFQCSSVKLGEEDLGEVVWKFSYERISM